jgi:hypothetical protein
MAAFKPGFEALIEAELLAYPPTPGSSTTRGQGQGRRPGPQARGREGRARQPARRRPAGELLKGKQRKEDVDWAAVHGLLKASKDLGGQMLFQLSLHTGDWLVGEGRSAEAKAMYLLPLRDADIAGNERARGLLEQKAASCDAPVTPEEAPKDAPK